MEPRIPLPSNIAEIVSHGEAKSWNALPIGVSSGNELILATPTPPDIPLVDDIGHILEGRGFRPKFEEVTDSNFNKRIDEFYRPLMARVLICKGDLTDCPFNWTEFTEIEDSPNLRTCSRCSHAIELATSGSQIDLIRSTDRGAAIAHYDDVLYIVNNDPFPTYDDD